LAWGFSQPLAAFTLWSITLVFNLLAMRIQGVNLVVIISTAISIFLLLGFTVWHRTLNNS
jgi:UDP-GlcNAc:undecaprenyl-phosphate GlcNAc-1-phosphate transferase